MKNKTILVPFEKFSEEVFNFFFNVDFIRDQAPNDNKADFLATLFTHMTSLNKSYKQNPYRKKSGYTFKFDGVDYKIIYIFAEKELYFKLLTRTGSRYRRKAQKIITL
jgi:hypothetical protein